MSGTVRGIMTKEVIDVQPDSPLTRVLQLMVTVKARSLPVRGRDGRLVGMISREDIMRALKEAVQQR